MQWIIIYSIIYMLRMYKIIFNLVSNNYGKKNNKLKDTYSIRIYCIHIYLLYKFIFYMCRNLPKTKNGLSCILGIIKANNKENNVSSPYELRKIVLYFVYIYAYNTYSICFLRYFMCKRLLLKEHVSVLCVRI